MFKDASKSIMIKYIKNDAPISVKITNFLKIISLENVEKNDVFFKSVHYSKMTSF